jgi:undecaprenyl-diphosphatase
VPAFGGFMHFMNAVGDTTVYILLVVVLVVGFAVLRAGWESVLVFLTLVPNGIGVALKSWVGRPRPSSLLVHVTSHETDPSFPSGHTLKTAALFAVLVFVLPAVVPWRPVRWALMAVCLVFVLAAGPARVYVGAHWPSDVLGSYLLAFLCLSPLVVVYLALRGPAPARDEPGGG